MIANPSCVNCVLTKQLKRISTFPGEDRRTLLSGEITEIIQKNAGKKSAPWLQRETDRAIVRYYPPDVDYPAIKSRFNRYMLSKETEIEKLILASDDRIEAAIRFACAGNYIDFSALASVSEDILSDLLEKAASGKTDPAELARFRADLAKGGSFVYITDNCGEIVMDKLLIKYIMLEYPALMVTALVRGMEAQNDATMEDAEEVGLPALCRCLGNGSDLMGTDPEEISRESYELLRSANIIVAKGQANFETTIGEGFNPYYLFMCKCNYFMDRFGLEQFSSVFIREEQLS